MAALATREEVARLLGRAAFGATEQDLAEWVGRPYEQLVDHLLDVPPPNERPPAQDDPHRSFRTEGERVVGDPQGAAAWWLERMRTAQYPLEERMTLLWHGHFATAIRESAPDVGSVMTQNATMRSYALSDFRTLVGAITVDPAMLMWLNGSDSMAGKPNENYAREFLELFTVGTSPQIYGEQDVREAARVFTGWSTDPVTRTVRFDPSRHDTGEKYVLGRRFTNAGRNEYLQLIEHVLSTDTALQHVARVLVRNLAYVPAPGDPLVAHIAKVLGDATPRWSIRPALRALFVSKEFRTGDASAGRRLVRSPVQTVVASCRAIGVMQDAAVHPLLERMGQVLFQPPSVAGWPGGTAWLSASTGLARYEWALNVVRLYRAASFQPPLPAAEDLDGWARRLGLAPLSATTAAAVEHHLANTQASSAAARQDGVLALLLSSPDWAVI